MTFSAITVKHGSSSNTQYAIKLTLEVLKHKSCFCCMDFLKEESLQSFLRTHNGAL